MNKLTCSTIYLVILLLLGTTLGKMLQSNQTKLANGANCSAHTLCQSGVCAYSNLAFSGKDGAKNLQNGAYIQNGNTFTKATQKTCLSAKKSNDSWCDDRGECTSNRCAKVNEKDTTYYEWRCKAATA